MKKNYSVSIFLLVLFSLFYSSFALAADSGQRNWFSMASSADGSKIVASNHAGYIYTSTDSGVNWKEQTKSDYHMWHAVASSADGTKLAAGDNLFGYIYTSTDSGVTWTQHVSSGKHMWVSIASSADGMKLAAVDEYSYIMTSDDGGTTWKQQANPTKHGWASITSSSDGTKLAAIGDSRIYISTDSGATWKEQDKLEKIAWQSITSSADGMKLAAAPLRDYIYTSDDGGLTWGKKIASGVANWVAITSSADGTKLAAATNDSAFSGGMSNYSGNIFASIDRGATWVNKTPNGGSFWRSITSSANGSKIFAGGTSSYIYSFLNLDPKDKVNVNTITIKKDVISPISSNVNTAKVNTPNNLKGKILIQVESHGEAWYVNPTDGKRYYMANGTEALKIMKKYGNGMSNKDIEKIKTDVNYRKKFMGKILLQVESRGEAYYISFDGRYNYLKDGESALMIMKKLGLGISNINLDKIEK